MRVDASSIVLLCAIGQVCRLAANDTGGKDTCLDGSVECLSSEYGL